METDWLSVRWTGEELLIKQRRIIGASKPSPQSATYNEDDQVDEITDEFGGDGGDDDQTLPLGIRDSQEVTIDFSITLSPTYSVPVLWFGYHDGHQRRLESVGQLYKWLIPADSRKALHAVGVMGGISMAHHPVSDLPMYFVHPCHTSQALSDLKPDMPQSPENYLLVWLGLLGSAVGLYVPSKILMTSSDRNERRTSF